MYFTPSGQGAILKPSKERNPKRSGTDRNRRVEQVREIRKRIRKGADYEGILFDDRARV